VKQLNHVNKKLDKEPNQGGLIQLKNGQWWFYTPWYRRLGGRAASLLPVTWVAGWPIIGKVGADTIGTMVWSGKKPIMNQNTKLSRQIDESFPIKLFHQIGSGTTNQEPQNGH
jgi:hypothetical protein